MLEHPNAIVLRQLSNLDLAREEDWLSAGRKIFHVNSRSPRSEEKSSDIAVFDVFLMKAMSSVYQELRLQGLWIISSYLI